MYYIVQENLFREEGHAKLISNLERFNIPYELVDVRPFVKEGDTIETYDGKIIEISEEIEFVTDRKDVFCFGSLKLARLSKKYGWNPGALITENHNYEVYSKHYKENLLNYDSKIVKLGDQFPWTSNELFIRPTLDSKIFTGRVFKKEEWLEFVKNLLIPVNITTATIDTLIQVATPKNITQEIRCWVIDGKVVTQSTYMRGTFLVYDNIVDQDAIDFAQRMVDIFQLAKTFVIDVCLTNDEWKIVECGSTSCAGFYDADMQKIIMGLEYSYNDEPTYPSLDISPEYLLGL
jgi:hypothetical protein